MLLLLLLLLLSLNSAVYSYQYRMNRICLNDFLASSSSSSDSVNSLIKSIAIASIDISNTLRVLPLSNLDDSNDIDNQNASGDQQKPLDVLSNDIMKKYMNDNVRYIISEEDEKETLCNQSNDLIVAIDPLDGSSNIDCNVATGTIFGIFKCNANNNIIDSTNDIIAAGYVLYSSSTEFVLSVGDGTHCFTLDPLSSNYYLTRKNMLCPSRGIYYSLNEARSADWPMGLQNYIDDIKNGRGQYKQRYSSRYICSMCADLHRTLIYGGWAANPRYHLRLLYEAKPLAFLTENAHGKATDGLVRILDLKAKSYHDRTPLFMGSSEDIDELLSYGDVQQKGNIKY